MCLPKEVDLACEALVVLFAVFLVKLISLLLLLLLLTIVFDILVALAFFPVFVCPLVLVAYHFTHEGQANSQAPHALCPVIYM